MKCLILCCVLLFIVRFSVAFNILVVFTHAGQSHFRTFDRFFQELGKRGHNLTIITYVKTSSKVENAREILLLDSGLTEVINLDQVRGARSEKYGGAHLLEDFANQYLETAMSGKNFQNFLKENNTYDVIIAEYFNSNAYFGLITKFKAPVIGISSSGTMPWHPQWMGAPDNPSYIPILFMDYSTYMTFFERIECTILLLLNKWWYKSLMEWPGTKLSKKYIGEEPADPYKTDLYFVNTHHTLHGARPFTPSIIEVGGISIGQPKKLPSEIETWINEAEHGIIYFSLGSMIKATTMPEEKRLAFVKAFAKLPQRVLWKWENETLNDKPSNVMIKTWMPQFDILRHPNVKAFIAHGGLGGVTEAVHCGVPMIVMPQFGDQHYNARAVEASGAGIILKLNDVTEEKILASLQEVLKPEFQAQAQALSAKFRDRPLPPLETAIYWVEHLARHKNGSHMRSAALDMPLFQYFLLDVIGTFLVVFLFIFYLIKFIMRRVKNLTKISKEKIS